MSTIGEKFDKQFDVENLVKEVEEIEANGGGGDFAEVPAGSYDVKIQKLELGESKNSGNPMLICWFKILAGEYKGQLIFMNQVLHEAFLRHRANEFLRSLDSGEEVKFRGFADYENLIMDVFEAVDGKLEFGLKYGENSKGYKTYQITDVYDADGNEG